MTRRSMYTLLRNINYLLKHSLYDKEIEKEYYLADKIIEDCVYEIEEDQKLLPRMHILDAFETIDLFQREPKSFCRFGDGEIRLIRGEDQPFQKYDPILAEKLKIILKKKRPDLYVGINHGYFTSPIKFDEASRRYYRLNGYNYRHFYLEHCDPDNTYFDSGFSGRFFGLNDHIDAPIFYDSICNLFDNKEIVVVSGDGVLEKLKYDVFYKAKSKRVIHGPSKDAFVKYEELIEKIHSTVDKRHLVVLVLGMAAKVMAADLTDLGYMAWDVGHMAKYYDAYKRKSPYTKEFVSDFYAPD